MKNAYKFFTKYFLNGFFFSVAISPRHMQVRKRAHLISQHEIHTHTPHTNYVVYLEKYFFFTGHLQNMPRAIKVQKKMWNVFIVCFFTLFFILNVHMQR